MDVVGKWGDMKSRDGCTERVKGGLDPVLRVRNLSINYSFSIIIN